MNKIYEMSRYLLNQRVTKLSSRDEDVDDWLSTFRFKLFNFNDEIYYVRYLVIGDIQYKITISCFIENNCTIFIQNCENGKSYEENIELKPFYGYNEGSRIETICKCFINGFKYLNVDLSDAEKYYSMIK
ncbi:MAG: hypothetical protein E6356_14055 [Terrisporobacter othiniensis]|nr:hypothetical protein [Terrisporobacter othiniensis]